MKGHPLYGRNLSDLMENFTLKAKLYLAFTARLDVFK